MHLSIYFPPQTLALSTRLQGTIVHIRISASRVISGDERRKKEVTYGC
jgi:hypothetical protein